MGARQSKRSVDITTTPKKGDADSPVVEGEGKLERIGDVDAKLTNGDIHKETEAVSGTFPFYQATALRFARRIHRNALTEIFYHLCL